MTRLCLFALLVSAAACGGSGTDKPTTPGATGSAGGAGKPAMAGDVAFDVQTQPIAGNVFEPDAMGRPPMPTVSGKGKPLPLPQQKQKFQNTKDPVFKQVEAAIYASMLFLEAKKPGAKVNELVTEARDALREASSAAGAKSTDETTWRLLASYELTVDPPDYAAAETAWDNFIKKQPAAKVDPDDVAWQAYAALKQGKAADAIKIAGTTTKKAPSLSYVTAWAKWRMHDDAGAWQAISEASQGWPANDRQVIDRDLLLFASRNAGLTYAAAKPALLAAFPSAKNPDGQYSVLSRLGAQAYGFAGRWQDAVDAIDDAIKLMPATAAPTDKFLLPYNQADFLVRLDNPDAAAKAAKKALDAIQACGACDAKVKVEIVNRIAVIARLFHVLYATANDIRYYQPANDIYIAVIPQIADPSRRAEVNKDAQTLQNTFKQAKAGTGTHDKGAIGALLGQHNQEILACYEAQLISNPTLGGTVKMTISSDDTGASKDVTIDPAPGAQDLPGVSACVKNSAQKWKLPKRGMKGNTKITIGYSLSPPKKTGTAAAGGGATPASGKGTP